MGDVVWSDDRLLAGSLTVSFQRTLRVPEDGRIHRLPPTFGRFPVHPVARFARRLPGGWSGANRFFVPMYQREALWLAFDAAPGRPAAVTIGAGGINVVSGETWVPALAPSPQDYVVCPPQLWVDGVNVREGEVRQFVCAPLGEGATVEAQLRGSDAAAGIQLAVFEARPGAFPDGALDDRDSESELPFSVEELGVGAGGFIGQKIYADPHGINTWQPSPVAELSVHLMNSAQYRDATGLDPPPPPFDPEAYAAAGLPWFEVYDEDVPHVGPSPQFGGLAGGGTSPPPGVADS